MFSAATTAAYAFAMAGQSAVERAQNAVRVTGPGAVTQASTDPQVSATE
jgi:hypothetical protein